MVGTDVEPGIMVLTLNYLYQEMHRTRHDQKYSVKMSYLEVRIIYYIKVNYNVMRRLGALSLKAGFH